MRRLGRHRCYNTRLVRRLGRHYGYNMCLVRRLGRHYGHIYYFEKPKELKQKNVEPIARPLLARTRPDGRSEPPPPGRGLRGVAACGLAQAKLRRVGMNQ